MFSQQIIPALCDRALRLLAIGGVMRIDTDIAFAIEAHRTVAQIGRANPQKAFVNDEHLGVHIDVLTARCYRMIDMETLVVIFCAQSFDQIRALSEQL